MVSPSDLATKDDLARQRQEIERLLHPPISARPVVCTYYTCRHTDASSTADGFQCPYARNQSAEDVDRAAEATSQLRLGDERGAVDETAEISDKWFQNHILTEHLMWKLKTINGVERAYQVARIGDDPKALSMSTGLLSSFRKNGEAQEALRKAAIAWQRIRKGDRADLVPIPPPDLPTPSPITDPGPSPGLTPDPTPAPAQPVGGSPSPPNSTDTPPVKPFSQTSWIESPLVKVLVACFTGVCVIAMVVLNPILTGIGKVVIAPRVARFVGGSALLAAINPPKASSDDN